MPFGLFNFTSMPFGLRNAAQTFQCFMDQVLRGFPFVYDYNDDILVASATKEEHLVHLREVCHRLDAHGKVVNPDKCVLGVPELDFLGHRVNKHGVCSLEEKVDIIRQFPQPTSQQQLRRFLGLVNFYHAFVPGCPATPPLSPGQILPGKSAPYLELRSGDRLHPSQGRSGRCYPAGSPSSRGLNLPNHQCLKQCCWRSLTTANPLRLVPPPGLLLSEAIPHEDQISTFDRELLAVYLVIRHFRHLLEGRQFFVVTDHKPLLLLSHPPNTTHRGRFTI